MYRILIILLLIFCPVVNYEESLKWFRKGAEISSPLYSNLKRDCIFYIGVAYLAGFGVQKDYSQSIYWLKKAADLGHSVAAFNLGNRYMFGEGVSKNEIEAVKWWKKAADLGNHINLVKKIADAFNGDARIIFYYAGHGIPDETEKTGYLLPVDGYGNDATSGYSLKNLYLELSAISSKSVTIFIDACFSGAQRDGDMIMAARGVAIKPKEEIPKGQLVVFTAAQGDETAYPYTEKQHGMFTYYLLKKIQETKGDVTLGELKDFLITEVKKQSILQNSKLQTPTVIPSMQIGDWRNLKLK